MIAAPLFTDAAGRRSADPLELAGPAPAIDLEALALLLAPPVLMGEFTPACPWKGVDRVLLDELTPQAAALPETFGHAIKSMTASAERIGVMVSGGLDSLAVLHHALDVANGRRVIAFTTDLTDDAGASAATVVGSLLGSLRLPAELVVLDPAVDLAEPRWSPSGPRLDALPGVNAAAAARAGELGVDILLSGDGADELLGVPRFAAKSIAAHQGPFAAMRYVRDIAISGPGTVGELTGFASQVLPPTIRARVYWAANWPEWCDPVASAVLAEPYRSYATNWAREWVGRQVGAHAKARRTWSEADSHDALHPHDPIPAAGPLPEASPFLEPTFVAAALALPLSERYDRSLPTAYQRCKAQVVRLFPCELVRHLPQAKQYFSSALALHMPTEHRAPRCVAAGLLDPRTLAIETDPSVLLVVAAIERWLDKALEIGPEAAA